MLNGASYILLAMAAFSNGQVPPSLSREMVAAHNAIRARVGSPPVTWSDQLAWSAQEWADRLIRTGAFVHHPNPVYGENLYEIIGARASAAQMVNSWASEARDYDYRSNTCRARCGHYTQIVWADTKKVGCAVSYTASREVSVCEYDPQGNIIGQRPW